MPVYRVVIKSVIHAIRSEACACQESGGLQLSFDSWKEAAGKPGKGISLLAFKKLKEHPGQCLRLSELIASDHLMKGLSIDHYNFGWRCKGISRKNLPSSQKEL
jgi:hypothetical protein